MSLLKPGKFLKTERKIKKDKDLVMFILPKSDAALLVCQRAGLGPCSLTHCPSTAQEQHMACPTPVKPSEHDCFSFASLRPAQLSNRTLRSPFSGHATQTLSFPLWNHLPTGLRPTASHLLWIWTQKKTHMNEVVIIVQGLQGTHHVELERDSGPRAM